MALRADHKNFVRHEFGTDAVWIKVPAKAQRRQEESNELKVFLLAFCAFAALRETICFNLHHPQSGRWLAPAEDPFLLNIESTVS